MPTDEQRMREQFEKWADKEVLWQHLDVRMERDEWGGYQDEMELDIAWEAWSVAAQARDAEVQELREALTEVTEDLASEITAKYGPIQAHPDTVRSFDREMEPVRRARKLLAGGEEGEPE